MKMTQVFLVMSIYDDAEGDSHQRVENIFSTLELAQEFINHTIGHFEIETHSVLSQPTKQTVNTKQMVAEGRIVIKKKDHGVSFLFTGKTRG
jgi:hypothetical protein